MVRKKVVVSKGKVVINNGKDEIIVSVRRDHGDKRHIIITAPSHMKWAMIWRILRKLPKHIRNNRKG